MIRESSSETNDLRCASACLSRRISFSVLHTSPSHDPSVSFYGRVLMDVVSLSYAKGSKRLTMGSSWEIVFSGRGFAMAKIEFLEVIELNFMLRRQGMAN